MYRFRLVLILAVLLLATLPTAAQNASGSLGAGIYDGSGAVVPNAKVVLRNDDTGALRETVTNASGFFNIPAIQPGSYTLTISAHGFANWQRTGIVFNQGESRTLPDVTLQVAATSEQVQVTAEAAAMETALDTGESRQTLDSTVVSKLAIQGRDAAELIKIMPGMAMNRGLQQSAWNSLITQSNSGPIGQYSANGTEPNGALTMTLDGANLLDPGNQGTQVANVNADQTAEVTLLNSAFGAEYAKGPVTLQAIGKSGTAHFHGAVYIYGHSSIFNATDAYLKSIGARNASDRSYYPGAEIGGPVLIPGTRFNRNRDKLFFYFGPEGMRQTPQAVYHSYFVPTKEMLGGNFSQAYLDSLGSGFASARGGDSRQPTLHGAAADYPGGYIPLTLLDPNSLAYAKTFPQAGKTDGGGSNAFYALAPDVDRLELRLRVDYNISDNTKLFVSWNRQDEFDQNPISVWYSPPSALPYPSGMPAHQVSNIVSGNLTHVFSPSLTNETVISFARFLNPVHLANPDAVDLNKVGLTGFKPIAADPYMAQMPNINNNSGLVPGYAAPAFGTAFHHGDFGKMSFDPSFADNLSKVAGKHTMKFGFYWDFARNNQPGGLGNWAQGMLTFDNTGATTSGNVMADFLTGRVQSFAQVPALSVYDLKYSQYSFYAQDQWKAHRRLTITYGVRLDHMGQWYPTSGPGLAVWDPASYVNTAEAGVWTGLKWHARDSKIPRSGFPSRLFSVDPRFGIAYDLTGKGTTILRGGFGVYRYQISYNSATVGGIYDEPVGIPSYNIENPPNLGWNFAQYSLPGHGVLGLGGNMGAMLQGDARTPYTESYDFILSQHLPWHSLLEIEYSGNQSHDMLISGNSSVVSSLGNLNKTPRGAYFLPDPITGVVHDPTPGDVPNQDYRPYQNYQTMLLTSHGAYQNYNALQVTWNKQSGRATFVSNYTFGKVLGIRDGRSDNGAGNGFAADPWNLHNNYGPLAYDHTQIFNFAYVVDLPRPVRGHAFLGGLVNGWALSGVVQLQSGAPIQPNTGGNLNLTTDGELNRRMWLGTDSESIMPVLVCDPSKGLRKGQYFNPDCFALPERGTNGPAVWPYIRGPHYFNSDLSIAKTFRFRDRHAIEARIAAFNFLNHPLKGFNVNGSLADLRLRFASPVAGTRNSNTLTTGEPLYTTGYRVVLMSMKYRF